MQSGTKPTRLKYKDYDFLKSHPHIRYGQVALPDELLFDIGAWMPDQNVGSTAVVPNVPPQPDGCTNYSTADVANDLVGALKYSPETIEEVTHANANGGYGIRDSMSAALPPSIFHPERLGWFKQFFVVRPSGDIDWFDAFRLAFVSGLPEHRSMSIGLPWFPSWEEAAKGMTRTYNADGSITTAAGQNFGILPMPSPAELALIKKDPLAFSWHNSKIDGFLTVQNQVVLRDKSWQGNTVGAAGFLYFPREVINVAMSVAGTIAIVPTNQTVDNPLPVDLSAVQWITSYVLDKLNSIFSTSF